MKFCTVCDNMYYTQYDENNHLIYKCRLCKHVIRPTGTIVMTNTPDVNTKSAINEYTKYDPTIPRLYHIPCVNATCVTNRDDDPVPREIMYVRENHKDMTYVYQCLQCDTIWRNSMI